VRVGEIRRDLSSDEIRAMCEIYPATGASARADGGPPGAADGGSGTGSTDHGGCSLAASRATARAGALAVLVPVLALLRRAAGRRPGASSLSERPRRKV
jgi:hypothetical protein